MKEFLFNILLKLILGKTASVATAIVADLDGKDMISAEKRAVAFEAIKVKVSAEGKDLRTSLINLAIELIVNLLRERIK